LLLEAALMKYFVFTVITLLVLTGCVQNPVRVDYEPAFNFTAINSYAWAADNDASYGTIDNGLMDKRVKAALIDELSLRGLNYDKDNPDMLIGYRVRDEDKIDYYRYPKFHSYAYRHHRSLMIYDEELVIFRYKQRLFMVDVLDSERVLIWRGTYEAQRKNLPTPEAKSAHIRDMVAEILLHFPR